MRVNGKSIGKFQEVKSENSIKGKHRRFVLREEFVLVIIELFSEQNV